MRHLDLNLLYTFKTIADCKSLSLAAQRLHKTQAAISIQLKKLEDTVGKRLIERGYHSAELTPDGELLLQYARKLLALSNEALHTLTTEEVCGTVRFGIPDDYASAFLLPVLQQFTRNYPDVRLKIRNDISQNLFSGLDNGELDLALVTQRDTDVGGEALRREPLRWVAAEGVDITRDAPVPLALYPHGCGYRRHILNALSSAQRDYYIAFECTGVMGVKLAVDSGLAIAATSEPLIQPNWKILDAEEFGLPKLGAVIIELRVGRDEPSQAARYFANALRNQLSLV
ncbi:LysR substrate-binding domain-containing protein [Zobellella maritima]|uniref:LysR substrate-binding domain-containing protein n=1 Tax=Zobellella maritima TaxID=2059725 RepID=UPI0013005551|nr:LysR substrate-binding domain-containing protein [Zobellella maritima]